jgi:hypothetical protein
MNNDEIERQRQAQLLKLVEDLKALLADYPDKLQFDALLAVVSRDRRNVDTWIDALTYLRDSGGKPDT